VVQFNEELGLNCVRLTVKLTAADTSRFSIKEIIGSDTHSMSSHNQLEEGHSSAHTHMSDTVRI